MYETMTKQDFQWSTERVMEVDQFHHQMHVSAAPTLNSDFSLSNRLE